VSIILGTINQTSETECRVAITPDIVKLASKKNIKVVIENNAGEKSFFTDEQYKEAGAEIVSREEVFQLSDALVLIAPPTKDDVMSMREGQFVVGPLNSLVNDAIVEALNFRKVTAYAMERIPRTVSAAQSMDSLTSQASITGYKSVLIAAEKYDRFFPMLTTAAGTIKPAQVLILGAGVAGLQAIGTAKRLGAVVTAYDVRPAAKDEIASLGGKFLDLGLDFSKGQGEGGYARQLTKEEQDEQQKAVDEKAANFDIIITTAQVPGRKPPVLLTKRGVEGLKAGSIIVDCAASDLGGNVEGSRPGETQKTKNGVQILGAPNIASLTGSSSSSLYSRNLLEVVLHALKDGKLQVESGDEIDDAMVVSMKPNSKLDSIETNTENGKE
jgi:NAD(P) transhydrogenase subunit alpha